MNVDVLIVGQGLAGSTLAWCLAERGVSVEVVDRGGTDYAGRPSASRVAAGLITPVTGKRLTVADDFDTHYRTAREFYRSIERCVDAEVFQEKASIRVLIDSTEAELSEHRCADPRFLKHSREAGKHEIPEGLSTPHGAVVMPGAARLKVVRYLEQTRHWLESQGLYCVADVDDPIAASSARLIVLCQGHAAPPHRALDGVAFAPAKGEVLTIETARLRARRVVHRGVWIAPCESGVAGRYRVGSTTEWNDLGGGPTERGRAELGANLQAAGVTDFEIVDHQAAVRPATPNRRPTYGFSRAEPRVGWFNGLGAKGSLWAPFYAGRMADLVVAQLSAAGR